MDLPILFNIAEELNVLLSGGFINKIHQPLPREIVLRVRSAGSAEKRLVLSADPRLGRLHLTSMKIPNPPTPPRFCAYLRSHLQGARILSISCARDDRVVRISTVKGPRTHSRTMDLILELLGRDSNILLVDSAAGTIMECLHRIPEREGRTRIVLPGREYEPPPKGRAGRPVPDEETFLPKDAISPGISESPTGRASLTLRADPLHDEVFTSVNGAADALYSRELGATLLDAMRRSMLAPLKSRARSLKRRLRKIEADRERLERLAALAEDGELLKANLYRAAKGMEALVVTDWNTGAERTVTLDPALDPVANMEKIFRRAAKGRRGLEKVAARLQESIEEARALEDMIFFVESAKDVEELEMLQAEQPLVRQRTSKKRDSDESRSKHRIGSFLQFTAPSGRIVLVGRSAQANDRLLRHKAGKGDLWFHVKDRPGAHVLLPVAGKEDPPEGDLEFAASLAVRFSKVRGKGRVEVMVADVKDLGRRKGAMPGQVMVRRYRTIYAQDMGMEASPGDEGALNP